MCATIWGSHATPKRQPCDSNKSHLPRCVNPQDASNCLSNNKNIENQNQRNAIRSNQQTRVACQIVTHQHQYIRETHAKELATNPKERQRSAAEERSDAGRRFRECERHFIALSARRLLRLYTTKPNRWWPRKTPAEAEESNA